MKRFGAHFGTTDEKVNATGLITQARQSRWKLLAPTRVKLPNEFQTTSALHACPARKMHPRKTNVRAVVRPRALRDGNRHRSKFAKKKSDARKRERLRKKKEGRKDRRRTGGGGKKEETLVSLGPQSPMRRRCPSRRAPSILFPPVDLWRTMHYVNCERAAGDRGKSNNTGTGPRVVGNRVASIETSPTSRSDLRPKITLRNPRGWRLPTTPPPQGMRS